VTQNLGEYTTVDQSNPTLYYGCRTIRFNNRDIEGMSLQQGHRRDISLQHGHRRDVSTTGTSKGCLCNRGIEGMTTTETSKACLYNREIEGMSLQQEHMERIVMYQAKPRYEKGQLCD
jgi:hypothetical protein